jgi:hypothetical protein
MLPILASQFVGSCANGRKYQNIAKAFKTATTIL